MASTKGHMRNLGRAWDDWAKIDPHFAVLTDPNRRNGGWRNDVDAFFASGTQEVAGLVAEAQRLGQPTSWRRALDFGCGVGRVTQALATVAHSVVGVDVSESMIAEARSAHESLTNIEFRRAAHPRDIASERFDLVWSILVLQHLGSSAAIAEALEILANLVLPRGLLVVEIPHRAPRADWRARVRVRSRAYEALRRCGASPTMLRRRLKLSPPMTMAALPEDRVPDVLSKCGISLLSVRSRGGGAAGEFRRYTATR